MPAKCPYCARPLKGVGIKCRACRRYVLRWYHIVFITAAAVATVIYLLDFLYYHAS